MDTATLYLTASSTQPGAIGIFHVHAGEAPLRRSLDGRIGKKGASSLSNSLPRNGLRYGWLHAADGEVIDEVMLACPAEGLRILMTHGGKSIRERVERYLGECGFSRVDAAAMEAASRDPLLDVLLAGCVTEGQVAALLEARRAGRPGRVHPDALLTHRIVLAGAPNAGKSSIMNMLAGFRRAFVHEEAGATRDIVDELVDLAGYAVLLGDLPGFSASDAGLAREAWLRARKVLGLAEAVWFVCDGSAGWKGETDRAAAAVATALAERGGACRVLVVVNKSDLPGGFSGEPWRRHFPGAEGVRVCALPGGDARERLEAAAAGMWNAPSA